MKCKKCGYEWQTYGVSLACPNCRAFATMTQSEKQTLWEKAYEAEKIKDYATRTACYFTLAELGDERAEYAYAECLRRGVGVESNSEEALLWYKESARRLYPSAAYRLACLLKEEKRLGDTARQVLFWLRVAAEFGDPEAAYDLFRMYEDGESLAPSHTHALFWLTRAAKSGNDSARVELARMYYTGEGVEKNYAAARYFMKNVTLSGIRMRLFKRQLGVGESEAPREIVVPTREEERLSLGKQAERDGEYAIASHIYFFASRGGNAEATYRLGLFYEEGKGVPKSEEEARRRYTVAAKAGNSDALLRLGTLCETGKGGPQDIKKAIACYQKLEDGGVAEGAFRLGELYRLGERIKGDYREAIRHYKKASALGHEDAKEALEKLRAASETVFARARQCENEGDGENALSAYRMAAEMGHPTAAYVMGVYAERTLADTRRGRKEAFLCYRFAAESGHIGGIYRLALCYRYGFGVKRDYGMARDLLAVAERQNQKGASDALADMKSSKYRRVAQRFYAISSVLYRKGNLAEAIKFRNIAAKLGSARAMYVLGCHFEFGEGVNEDRTKANAWYARAIAAGFDPARCDLKGAFLRERKRARNI